MRTVTEQQFVDAALADTDCESGVYHALQRGCIMFNDCICNPVLEVLNDNPKKHMYWHRKHMKPVVADMENMAFADPSDKWPFSKQQVEIVGDDKLLKKDNSGAEHSEIRP